MSNIQESLLQAAIPGQSLTDEPKNFPWERPAEYSDPIKAAEYELKKLNDLDTVDSIVTLLHAKFPVIALAETIKTNSQAEGLYNPDIGLLITPVIKEQLVAIAEEADIEFVMGDEEDLEEIKKQKEERVSSLVAKKIMAVLKDDPEDELLQDALSFVKEDTEELNIDKNADDIMMSSNKPEIKIEPEEDTLVAAAPTGLMSRSTM
jgi:hypothetical protein|tara:strand:- start:25 stop:642 length:618 start_codon:yes stop_codon:yes gene_type:complete